jgi:ATP-dependent RNA helicase SUPV3L1/SUV3
MFAELQPLWKEAIKAALPRWRPCRSAQPRARHAMIEEAKVLGAAPMCCASMP